MRLDARDVCSSSWQNCYSATNGQPQTLIRTLQRFKQGNTSDLKAQLFNAPVDQSTTNNLQQSRNTAQRIKAQQGEANSLHLMLPFAINLQTIFPDIMCAVARIKVFIRVIAEAI